MGRKRLRGRPRKLRRRRSALRRLRLSVRRCLRPRRPKRLKWLTRRNPPLEEKSMMPARSSPRPRSSLRKRRRLPLASESSHLNLRPWTLMKSRPRLRSSSRSSFSLRLTNMTMSRGNSLRSLTSRSLRRDRRLSSELRPLRRVLTQRPSLESTHQRSACTPSMSEEQIPDLMVTERKCMREAGKLSELNTLNLSGKRSTRSGARDLPEDSPSGLERDLARRRETQRPQRVVRKKRLLLLKRKNMMKKKKMRRNMMRKRNKSTSIPKIEVLYLSNDLPGWYIPHSDCFKRLSSNLNCQKLLICQFEIVILLKIHSENCNFISQS